MAKKEPSLIRHFNECCNFAVFNRKNDLICHDVQEDAAT